MTPSRPSEQRDARSVNLPWLTLMVGSLACAAWLIPGAAELLQFDRTALARGELWRGVTGHLTHWTNSHLVWDVVAFVLFGGLLERRSGAARLATLLLASSVAISASVWHFERDLATYRGLSGVDSGLFVALVLAFLRDTRGRERHTAWASIVAYLALAGFLGKTAWELVYADTLFVTRDAAFSPVPLAHLVGAAAATITILVRGSLVRGASSGDAVARIRQRSTTEASIPRASA